MNSYRIMGVSGSLRTASLNSLFLRAMKIVRPENIEFTIYNKLGALPPFNPDNQDSPGADVLDWRAAIMQADMVMLVSPEYALGVSGVMKNALDWIVGGGELINKPLAFPNISFRANQAQSQLEDMLRLMGGILLEDCSPRATREEPLVLPGTHEFDLSSHAEIGPRLMTLWSKIECCMTKSKIEQPGINYSSSPLWNPVR